MSEFWKAFLLMLKLVIDSWSERGDNGQVDLKGIALIPRGLVSVACKGGTYTDEATGKLIDLGQMVIRAATIYSGTGPLMMLSSPLSEVAYQLADTNSNTTINITISHVSH
jgi:hypothetical protein